MAKVLHDSMTVTLQFVRKDDGSITKKVTVNGTIHDPAGTNEDERMPRRHDGELDWAAVKDGTVLAMVQSAKNVIKGKGDIA